MGISEFKHLENLPEQFKGTLPTIEEIEISLIDLKKLTRAPARVPRPDRTKRKTVPNWRLCGPEVSETRQRLFQDTVNRLLSEPGSRPWTPAVDILEAENDLILKADLPEMDMKDIEIKIENGTLSLSGQRKLEKNDNQKGFHRIGRSYGSFVRYFTLPDTVDTEKVHARLDAGVLSISLPKKEVAKLKTIKVQGNHSGNN